MSEGPDDRLNEAGGLSQSRADFVASFERRLQGLRGALHDLQQEPESAARRDTLLRRVHALGAAAKVLGFAAAAEQLAELEEVVQDVASDDDRDDRIERAVAALEGLPGLVSRARRDRGAAAPPVRSRAMEAADPRARDRDSLGPVAVLLYGPVGLEASLSAAAAEAELEVDLCGDPEAAVDRILAFGPDVVIIADDQPGAQKLLDQLCLGNDDLQVPIIVVKSGRVELPVPVGLAPINFVDAPVRGHELWTAVQHSMRPTITSGSLPELGPDPTVADLAEHLALEVRRALVGSARSGGKGARLRIDNPSELVAPLWSALARIRETITVTSGGTIDFEPLGPQGGVALAPEVGDRRSRGARRSEEGVDLKGRTVVVVDDDPSVVEFISSLVRDAGAQVVTASNGRDALRIAQQQWPDLLISDITMPEMDGLSLCREIKRDVAVSDTPVILLSWKEDLLFRLRELGADADGYLRKEASAPSILRTLKEVLAPRARVESRLDAGGDVRGRLDGLTPRLVLQLVCGRRPNACVAFRDPAFLYEAQVRDGQLRCATRTASDGSFERGRSVLAALLGASAGRFAVTTDTSRCREDFQGPLSQVLASPVRRARAAQHATAAAVLGTLKHVAIDPAIMAPYLRVMPPQTADLLEQLMGGASPRALLLSGSVAPHVLEHVLSDAARRGAIIAAEGRGGVDLLEAALRELEGKGEPAQKTTPAAPTAATSEGPPSHPPRFSSLLSPLPGPVQFSDALGAGEPAAGQQAEGLRWAGSTPAGPKPGVEGSLRPLYSLEPRETVEIDEAWGSEPPGALKLVELQARRDQGPGNASDATEPDEPETKRGVGSTQPPEAAAEVAERRDTPARTAHEQTPSTQAGEGAALGVDLAEAVLLAMVESGTAGPPAVRPRAVRGPDAEASSPEENAEDPDSPEEHVRVSDKASALRRPVAPRLETGRVPAVAVSVSKLQSEEEAAGAAAGADAAQAVKLQPRPREAADDDDLGTFELKPFSRERSAPSTPKRVAAADRQGADPDPADAVAEPAASGNRAPAEPSQVDEAASTDPHDEVTVPLVRASDVERGAPMLAVASSAERQEPPPEAARAEPPADGSGTRPGARKHDEADAEVARDRAECPPEKPPASKRTGTDTPSEVESGKNWPEKASTPAMAAASPADRAQSSKAGRSPKAASGPPSKRSTLRQELVGGVRLVAMAALAGLASYFAMRYGMSALGYGADSQRKPAAVPAAVEEKGPGAEWAQDPRTRAKATHKAMPKPERLPLPPGVNVAAGQGLLEIDSGNNHVIYVDGVFVGRGPLRRVTLPPGPHTVRVSLGSEQHEQIVEVPKDARVRLPLSEAWK